MIPAVARYLLVSLDSLWLALYCLHMAPVPTAKADGAKIRELIRERGTVAAFARRLGRHPQSFWDIANPNRDLNVSITFLRQIARELGVKPSDISDLPDDESEAA